MSSTKSKSGSKWKETRHDKYYKLAREQGYRSRAAFKLIQINKKYNFLGSSRAVLDLCAAPGGWMQVCRKYMPASSLIIGIDLKPIKAIPGCVTLQNDITTQQCRTNIKKELQSWTVDAVVHDGAPNVGGSTWARDAYQQIELVLHSLKLATEFLRKDGVFVTKVFRSQDYNSLLWLVQQFFHRVDPFKPPSSRDASAEIFLVCLGFKAPKKVDPKLFDPAYVFKQVDGPKKAVDVLHGKMKKKVRSRSGYEDGDNMLQFTSTSVSSFIDSKEPIEMLGTYSAFTFNDNDSKVYLNHAATTPEIKELIQDLKVLGKSDFKNLLKWRLKLREFKKSLLAEEAKDEVMEPKAELSPEEQREREEKKVLEKLEERQNQILAQQKRDSKKKREEKNKLRKKMELNMNNEDGAQLAEEEGLFSLSAIKDKKTLEQLHDDGEATEADLPDLEAILGREREDSDFSQSDMEDLDDGDDDEDDDLAYMRKLDKEADLAYEMYKERRQIQERKKARLGLEAEAEEDKEVARRVADAGSEDEDEDSDDEDGESNPLMVDFGGIQPPSAKDRAERWFEKDLFSDLDGLTAAQPPKALSKKGKAALAVAAMVRGGDRSRGKYAVDSSDDDDDSEEDDEYESDEDGDDEDDDDDDEEEAEEKSPAVKKARQGLNRSEVKRASSDNEDEDSDDDDDEIRKMKKKPLTKKQKAEAKKKKAEQDGFEEVPLSEHSDDSEAMAQNLAIGTAMLRKRKRTELIDSAYNRYSYDDLGELPEWFADDQRHYNQPQLPVTKEEVDAFKERLKAINAKPMKKIAEAAARKKMKTLKRWEKIKAKADVIAASTTSATEKIRSIEKLYKKAAPTKKKERSYVVSKKGGAAPNTSKVKKGNAVVRVDPRQKKDKRGLKRAEKRKEKNMSNKNSKKARSKKGSSRK